VSAFTVSITEKNLKLLRSMSRAGFAANHAHTVVVNLVSTFIYNIKKVKLLRSMCRAGFAANHAHAVAVKLVSTFIYIKEKVKLSREE
jgi:hypothetical protein